MVTIRKGHVAMTHKAAFSSWTLCKAINELFILSVLWFSICNVYMCVRAQERRLADHAGFGEDKCHFLSAVDGSATGEDLHCSPRCIQSIFSLVGNLTEIFSLQRIAGVLSPKQ